MTLRQRLTQPDPLRNLFLTTSSPTTTEWIARTDIASLTLDLQHGSYTAADLVPQLQAVSGTGTYPLVRLAWNRPEYIMAALDAGAHALICPMIDTAADAAAFVRAAKYPPQGNRSFGPYRAAQEIGADYFTNANRDTLAFAMVETAGAVDNLEAIAATPGLDGLFVGPFDLSVSTGLEKRADFTDEQLLKMIHAVLRAAEANELFTGVFTVRHADARAMAELDFDLITCGTDEVVFQPALAHWLARW